MSDKENEDAFHEREEHERHEQIEEIEQRAEHLEELSKRQKQLARDAEDLAVEEQEEAHELREEADRLRREEDQKPHEPHEHTVEVTMVVSGAPVELKVRETETLAELRYKALEETKNLAQPPENWEIKDENGDLLNPEKKVGEFHFGEKVTLFLSPKAGVAGV